MDLHFLSGFSPVPLGNGYLGRRVANRIQSARIFISVSGFLPAQGEPAECPLWTRRIPCPDTRRPRPKLFAKT